MKYFSAFSGIGGFELGIQTTLPNSECIGYSEIDRYATKIYKKHYPNHVNWGDIAQINEKDMPDFEMFCGGFPCQDLSIAGKREGLCGKRSGLFFEIIRIIQEKQPRIVFLENVRGLLSSNKGWDFARILLEMDESGYDVEWQVLNSKDFGVPQNRERVFIIGHLRGEPARQVFPIRTDSGEDGKLQQKKDGKGARVPCLNTRYGQRWSGEGYVRTGLKQINEATHSNNRIYDSSGISPTLNTMQGGLRQPKVYHIPSANKRGYEIAEEGDSIRIAHIGSKTGRGRVGKGKSQTLVVGGDMYTVQKSCIRRLMPLECERLQGFPDGWTEFDFEGKPVSDAQRYKCLGNAVTVNVIKTLAERL